MKKLNYLIIVCLFLLFISCNGNQTKSNTNSETKTEKQDESSTQGTDDLSKIYKVKSGHLLYNTSMEMTIETWFDDYGNTQYTESVMEIFGEKAGSYSYIIDGYKYDYSIGTSEGTKMKYYAAQTHNYDNFSQKDIEKYGLMFHPDETILNKKCQVISTKSPVASKVWIWEGIPVKTVSKIGKEDFIMELVQIETGAVDQEKFKIPEGVKFTDY